MTIDTKELRALALAAQDELPCDIPYTPRQFSDWQMSYRSFIAAACNAVIPMADELDTARARIAELEDVLRAIVANGEGGSDTWMARDALAGGK